MSNANEDQWYNTQICQHSADEMCGKCQRFVQAWKGKQSMQAKAKGKETEL